MTNRILGWSTFPIVRPAAAILFAATCFAWTGPATAAVDLSGGVAFGVEYDDNAFDRGNREAPVVTPSGNTHPDDTSTRLSANAAASAGAGGPLHLQLQGQYSRVDSVDIDSLDHSEHSYSGTLDWRPGQVFDASLQASQTRSPLSLADIGGERNVLQTSSQAQAALRLHPTPRWQVGITPAWRETKTPLPGAQNFRLRENSGSATLDFVGAGRVVPGILVSEARGRNTGIANPTRYRTKTVQGTMNYRVTALSAFSLSVGHTQRTTTLISPTTDPLALAREGTSSGFSGALSYQRQLSVKTAVNVSAFRTFEQYELGVNPSVNTGFSAGLSWAATPKVTVALGSQHTWTTIQGAQSVGLIVQRKELIRNYTLDFTYLATRRLSAHTYVARRIRNSGSSYADQYNGNSAGLVLTVTFD